MFISILAGVVLVFGLLGGLGAVGAVAVGAVRVTRAVVRRPAVLYPVLGVAVWAVYAVVAAADLLK